MCRCLPCLLDLPPPTLLFPSLAVIPEHQAGLLVLYSSFPLAVYLIYSVSPSVQRRQWHPTPVLLPGKSHGWRSLTGYSPWGCKESDMTEGLLLLLLSRFSRVRLCATSQTAAHQALPSLGFSRQGHWSGLPFPSLMHESEK